MRKPALSQEIGMAKQSLASMSVEALFKLRDEVAEAISSRAEDLRKQLSKLTGDKPTRGSGRKRKGRKVAPQFRSKQDPSLVWSGRGALPRWMKEEMKGTKLKKESFRIKE
ncbi:histidinol phosphate phosphatase [Rhodoplanes sp. Z2-YC6860]|nr:histidinol phosphate phosphatase [Rhodoplanes sp. Z2-YC6860]